MFANKYMDLAMSKAEQAAFMQEVPVGCVIVDPAKDKILAATHNIVEQNNNALFHAEILAINNACQEIGGKNLSHCDIYVTLEPCAMCACAISYARLARLYYSLPDKKAGAVENGVRLYTQNSCFHKPEIYVGLSEKKSLQLMQNFFSKLRKSGL